MTALTDDDRAAILALVRSTRDSLDRIAQRLESAPEERDDLDVSSPLNKKGVNLTPRGVEVCYRLFDRGDNRYKVKRKLNISYGAATHRFHAWQALGGKSRTPQPLN
jgi:hypothetical protein